MTDLVLPAFELDCRDWIVLSPAAAGLPEDAAGAPLLAVLSTVLIGDDLQEASGELTVGVVEDDELVTRPVGGRGVAFELLDPEPELGLRRYVMLAPGQQLALLAEFDLGADASGELQRRVDVLMGSFRWQFE